MTDATRRDRPDVPWGAPRPPANRLERVAPWVALGLLAVAAVFPWSAPHWYPEWDGALYLLTGASLAEGDGYAYQGRPFFLRPPGFPWLLSWLAGGDGYDFGRLNRLVGLFVALAATATFLALRPFRGTWTALAVALLTGTCPLWVRSYNRVMPEFPFMALFLASIFLLHRSLGAGRRWWLWSASGGLALAGAVYLRSAAILLVPGIVLLAAWRGRGAARWRGLLPALLVCTALLPWWVWSGAQEARAERPTDQLFLFSYSTAMWHVEPGDPESPHLAPTDWANRVRTHVEPLVRHLATCVPFVRHTWSRVLVVAVMIAGWGIALRRGWTLLEWFAATYGVLLLVYFISAMRLPVALAPFAYLYLFAAIEPADRAVSARVGGGRPWLRPGVGAFVILLLGNLVALPAFLNRDLRLERWLQTRDAAEWVRATTPDDAVVMCGPAPMVALLSDRRTYTYRYARGRDVLERYAPDVVLLDAWAPDEVSAGVRESFRQVWASPGDPSDPAFTGWTRAAPRSGTSPGVDRGRPPERE